jgi:hypothetical protein
MALTRPRYSQIPDSDYKNSCRIVTTTNVTLTSGAPLTYDGVTLAQYDRVLVAGQTDKTQNGIYSVQTAGSGSNGTWVRSKDANANDYLTAGMNTFIEEGTYAGQFWHLLTVNPIVLGVTELIFGQISGNAAGISSQVQYNFEGSIAGAANLRYDAATGNVLIGGGTASTSNVTGALTVNGGIGVTGEVWTYGNMYSAGSRVLTQQDLETRTFTANYISKDPANVAVPVVGTGTIYGTHNFGNLEAISTYGDYNTTAQSGYYSVNDASGAPGFIVYVGFTGISSFNRAVYNVNYTQQSGHTVNIDFYNYDNDAWDTFATYSGSGNWQQFALGLIDHLPYVDDTGNVTTRIYHVSSGNVSHRTWIDYVALEQSITGGQGPRGATGATGATGPAGTYSGGFIIGNVTVGNTIISNSGNVSISTTTGAIILTGNGGIGLGGNIFAGGNITANSFYTINGLFWSGNGEAFSSGLEVSEINTANALSNISTQVTSLRFDRDTGFSVTELNPGNVKISLGSSFKTWHVPGQSDLVAVAEDEVTFFGNGIDITTNPTFPKAITFISNNKVLEANIGAFYNYANANIGTLYLGNISTQANLGAFQTYANTTIGGVITEISSLYGYIDANAGIQSANIAAINANIGAFYAYANSKIGTNNNSNLVVTSTAEAVSAITGAVVVAGGVGIGGNLWVAGNIFASNLVAISSTSLTVQDPLLYLNADTPFPYNYDIGLYSHFVSGPGSDHYQHTGMARDYTTGYWNFFSNVTSEPGVTINWEEVNLIYDTVRVGDLIVANTTASTGTTSGALRVAGGAGIAGELYIANTGDVSANIGTLFLGNASTQANLGAFQTFANAFINELYLGNISTQANLGAFQEYANANIGTLFVSNASTQANLGAYQTYTNTSIATLDANVGTLYLGNISTQANLGLLYAANIITQANIGSIYNQLNTLDANVGSYEAYANIYLNTAATFTVTDSGSSQYIIDGENNPALYLIRGQRYNFSVDAIGNSFWIKTAPSIGSGDQYNIGVTNNGEDSGLLVFDVPLTAPDVLYYVSQFDAAMTNELRIVNFSTIDSNIGTLFLGNISTQANLGAFQIYANTTFTTYSNANVDAYLPIYSGNISAGNIAVTNKVAADTFYTTSGIYWSGNGNPYSTGGGSGITYTASTTPPVGPAIGDQWYDTAEGILYEYMDDGDTDQWVDIISPTFSGANPVAFTSNITVGGNILITDGIYWVGNGEPYASGGGSFSGEDTVLRANVGAYQIYANANIGTLYLGNISTQANLGAFQIYSNANAGSQAEAINSFNSLRLAFNTYANTKIGTNNNSNLVVVATTTSTNTTTGALVVGGGAGIAGAINVGSSGTFAGLIQTTATTAATSTATGALYVAGGAGIVGNLHAGGNVILGASTTTSNVVITGTRTSTTTTTGALVVKGGAGIVGNVYTDKVYTTSGIFWSGNNAVFAPPSSSIFTSNVVAASGTASTNTTTGALVVVGGAGISGAVYTGGTLRTGGALTVSSGGMGVTGDTVIGGGFLQVTSGYNSTSTTEGALTVQNSGGLGVTGNIHANKLYTVQGLYWSGNSQPFQVEAAPTFLSNLVAASGTPSTSINTGALVVAGTGGLGVGGDLNATAGSTVNGWTVGGLLWAACTTPATSATSGGGLLVNGGARILGNVYASGNIYLGANTSSNLVANATTTSTSADTGALVVRGGAGIAGNLYVGSEFVVPGGGKISTAGIANFLEKANVVVSAPAASIDVDLSSVSVMYWTSNSTTNMTANIRGDATTPLNSLLAIGQSVTTVLFIPNGVSNYYINSMKIDNVTITPAYSGNTSPTLGNPDSVDIYSFTILKTADATYKVFATQSQFQHPG